MNKKLNMIEKTFLFMWPVMIVSSLLIFLIGHDADFMLSFILGSITSLLANSLHYRVLKNTGMKEISSFRSKMVMMYFVKLIIYGIVLYFVATSERMNLLFAFGGIFSYYITLFIISLIVSNKLAKEERKDA
ncbi:MAG: ATP synthase subunit I [Firmicutes bacterium]|nr:ATP synthase subunit I [Bacillota bacterium]